MKTISYMIFGLVLVCTSMCVFGVIAEVRKYPFYVFRVHLKQVPKICCPFHRTHTYIVNGELDLECTVELKEAIKNQTKN